MKNWTSPVVEELSIKVTEYDPNGGTKADARLVDAHTGETTQYLYGPSAGNSGDPVIVGGELEQ